MYNCFNSYTSETCNLKVTNIVTYSYFFFFIVTSCNLKVANIAKSSDSVDCKTVSICLCVRLVVVASEKQVWRELVCMDKVGLDVLTMKIATLLYQSEDFIA